MAANATSHPMIRSDRFIKNPAIHSFPSLHPLFCIRRPSGQIVPLVAMDELPQWLFFVGIYPIAHGKMQLVSSSFIPRVAEYDIICLFCESASRHVSDDISWTRSKGNRVAQYQDALMRREYPPYVYPTSYYRQERSFHHWDSMDRFLRPDAPKLNPEARVFIPSVNNAPAHGASSESRAQSGPTVNDDCRLAKLVASGSPTKEP